MSTNKVEGERYNVAYEGGQSRYTCTTVDYMLCELGDDDETELYAEMENPTWNPARGQFDDETATRDALMAEIIKQAREHGIREDQLNFD